MRTRGQKLATWPVAAAFASVLMVGCAEETPVQEAQDEGTEAAAAMLNETVTFENEVTEVHGPNLFTVGDEDTPVVGFDAAAAGLEDGDRVEVTGTVRQIVLTDTEAWGGFDFDQDENNYLVERELDLGVVAENVQAVPEE
ncbi:hypothetical protein [Kocuria flava]|uniref:hypothetical protein n=1 Tax=Kocuria flava TaxID=446860 RepID=UPI00118125D9|nr:hypothetical protein [Kocuria flava]